MTTPRLAVVVSTIGRPAELRRLLESLSSSERSADIEVVVIDQSVDRRCSAVVQEGHWAVSARATTSERGASLGRNTGLPLTTAPVVAFPDDDAWYPEQTPGQIIDAFASRPRIAGLCCRQLTSDGRPSMLRWQSRPGMVTAQNFLRTSIMSTMFFRREWLDRVGPFDENMGVGSSSWYGACEESDLLLRVLEAGGEVPYEPSLLVFQEEPRDVPDGLFVTKMLSYGCGQGHLWRKHRLPTSQLTYYCARKLAGAAVRAGRGQVTLARADLAWMRGSVAGFRDVPPRALYRPTFSP